MLFFSYAEVRAERRRAFGFEELSPPEIAPSSVKVRLQCPSTHSVRHLQGQSSNLTPVLNITLCSRLRSCTWTSAPHWTLHRTETVVHVRYPRTAPWSPPTQRCRILHVSHPLLPKVLTHSTAGQNPATIWVPELLCHLDLEEKWDFLCCW